MSERESGGYGDVVAAVTEHDPQLARDLLQAIGEAITLHAREGAGGDSPEVAARLARLRAFRDALAERFPEAT